MNRHLHTIISPLIIAPLALCIPQAYAASATIPFPQEEHSSQSASESTEEETADETATVTDLDELVVEGRTQRVVKNGVEYSPDKQTRKMSHDAISLLQAMQIPQLSISPITGDVKTQSQQDVTFFIDYIPASPQELMGLRPEDVLSVEVLTQPDDPRFYGAQYVINYIMRKYEWGGYTKLTAKGTTLGVDMADGLLYSKFAYKNWMFDANVTASMIHNTEMSDTKTTETYRDIFFNGKPVESLTSTLVYDPGQMRLQNSQYSSLRAIYFSKTYRLIHNISFYRNALPEYTMFGQQTFSKDLLPGTEVKYSYYSQDITPAVAGDYMFMLSPGNYLSATWNFSYTATRLSTSNRLGDMNDITRNNREKAYAPAAQLNYTKYFSKNSSLQIQASSANNIYRTDYFGSSYDGAQDLVSSSNTLTVGYDHILPNGIDLFARAGGNYILSRLNGETVLSHVEPSLYLWGQYPVNQSHQVMVTAGWSASQPQSSYTNTAFVQTDELTWQTGNPDLGVMQYIDAAASYAFIPNNNLAFNALLMYNRTQNLITYQYAAMPQYNGIVRQYINSGSKNTYTARLSGTAYLLNRQLSLSATFNADRTVLTGTNKRAENNIYVDASVLYSLKNFGFRLFYQSPQKLLLSTGWLYTNRSTYGVNITYTAGDFNAEFQFANWFNRNHQDFHFTSQHYDCDGWSVSSHLSRRLRLTLTYTLPYGKLVDRNNELQTSGSVNSAILK